MRPSLGQEVLNILLRLPAILLIILAGGCQSTPNKPLAIPPELFREIGYEDAVLLSTKENKPLFLYFDGDWAKERQKLITKTLANPTIAPQLRDRTIALRIEVVDLPDIAKKHRVASVPVIVLVAPGGREIARWSGAPKPESFSTELNALLSGSSASEFLQAKIKASDLVTRHKLAEQFVAEGQYAEALRELLWLYNIGIGPGELERRDLSASTVIKSIGRLKEPYPPAADALVELCEREKQNALRSPNDGIIGRKLTQILQTLDDNDSALAVYHELRPGRVRSRVGASVIVPLFVKRQDYASAARELPVENALRAIAEIEEMNAFGRGTARTLLLPIAGTKVTSIFLAEEQRKILQRRAYYFEIYAGADQVDDARQVATVILKEDRLKQAPEVLRESAKKVCGDRTDAFLQALALPELLPPTKPQPKAEPALP
jgi:hypothetical protein